MVTMWCFENRNFESECWYWITIVYIMLPLCIQILPLCRILPFCMCGYHYTVQKTYIMVAKVNLMVAIREQCKSAASPPVMLFWKYLLMISMRFSILNVLDP